MVDAELGKAATAASYSASSVFTMHGCRITRWQLDRLWRLMEDGFPEDAQRSFSTTRRAGGVESRLEAETLEGLLTALQESTVAGDPERVDNLDLSIRDAYNAANLERSIRLDIVCTPRFSSQGYVSVSVSGKDAGWVRGRAEGLKDLLEYTQSPKLSGRGRARWWYTLSAAILNQIVSNSVIYGLNPKFSVIENVLFFVSAYPLLLGGAYLAGAAMDRRCGTSLVFEADTNSKKSIDKVSVGILIIAIVTLATIVVQTLIAHLDAIDPHH